MFEPDEGVFIPYILKMNTPAENLKEFLKQYVFTACTVMVSRIFRLQLCYYCLSVGSTRRKPAAKYAYPAPSH